MDNDTFQYWLKNAALCPSSGDCACARAKLIPDNWAVLLGWGNPSGEVLFVGNNPLDTPKAREWHKPLSGLSPFEHALLRSSEDLTKPEINDKTQRRVRHFAYHERIFNSLRTEEGSEGSGLPSSVKDFAFFTEAALCPTKKAGQVPRDVRNHCFHRNVQPFIEASEARVIVSVGRTPGEVCLLYLSGKEALEDFQAHERESFHGLCYDSRDGKRVIITSMHPAAFGYYNPDRAALSRLLHDLRRRGEVRCMGSNGDQ